MTNGAAGLLGLAYVGFAIYLWTRVRGLGTQARTLPLSQTGGDNMEDLSVLVKSPW